MRRLAFLLPVLAGLTPTTAWADGLVLATPSGPNTQGQCYALGNSGPRVPCVLQGTTWTRVLRPTDPIDGATVSGSTLSSFIKGAGGKTMLVPDALRATRSTANAPNCASTDGSTAANGTLAWEPNCFGTFVASGQDIVVYPTRGTNRKPDGAPDQYMYSNILIQSRGDGGIKKETNGLFINHETVGGSESAARLDTTNSTGQLISVRQRPGPNGEKPPTTWGFNIDHVIENGAGAVQSYNAEFDLNNYNQDCKPGFPCLSAALYFNGIGSYVNTAWIYSGGGTTDARTITVTASNNTVTRVSGQVFRPSVYRLTIGSTTYRVTYVDADHVTGVTPIPDIGTATAATWANPMVANGILFQGDNMASDNDLALNTAAYTAVRAAGRHFVAFDTSLDAARYSLVSGEGQKACFAGFNSCFVYGDGNLRLEQNGSVPFRVTNDGITALNVRAPDTQPLYLGNSRGSGFIVSDAGGPVANVISIQPATAGFGPTIRAVGSDSDVGLNIYAQGSASIALRAPILAPNLSTTGGAVKGTLCVDTSGAVYVKTTSGACL